MYSFIKLLGNGGLQALGLLNNFDDDILLQSMIYQKQQKWFVKISLQSKDLLRNSYQKP